MRSYKKYKLESNIKKEYEKLKRRMKYPVQLDYGVCQKKD